MNRNCTIVTVLEQSMNSWKPIATWRFDGHVNMTLSQALGVISGNKDYILPTNPVERWCAPDFLLAARHNLIVKQHHPIVGWITIPQVTEDPEAHCTEE